MNKKNHTNPTKTKVVNTQFKVLAKALNDLKNGTPDVKFKLFNDLERDDRFLVTRTFPFSLLELRGLFSEYKKWQQIIEAVPHLIQKQKVIYLIRNSGNILNARIADKFYKNELERKSIHLKSMKDFNFIRNKNQKAVIFQEYSFNYSRFFIEVLKYFEKKGGRLSFSNEADTVKNEQKPAVLIPVETNPKFELVVKEHGSLIRFIEKGENILTTQIDKNTPVFSANELRKTAGKYLTIESEKTETTTIDFTPALNVIHEIIVLIDGRLHCSFESNRLNDYFEICLEKFDLAKQTGISFEDFKTYFHRYGKGIDEVMEIAYQLLGTNRDPKEIWNSAESEFQAKYEWKNENVAI